MKQAKKPSAIIHKATGKVDPICEAIGRNISTRRKALGMSQTQLANYLDGSQQQILKFEKGINTINAVQVLKISIALRCPVETLFRGTDDSQPRNEAEDQNLDIRETKALLRAYSSIEDKRLRKSLFEVIKVAGRQK